MPQVATTVEFSDKEIRDMLVEAAKRQLKGSEPGSVKTELHYSAVGKEPNMTDTGVAKTIAGIVSFNAVGNNRAAAKAGAVPSAEGS